MQTSANISDVRHCTTDAQGWEITVVNSPNGQVALDQFNIAVDQFANFSASPIQALDKALAADPDFFMGHFLKAAFYGGGRSDLDQQDPKFNDCIDDASSRLSTADISRRERQLGTALGTWNKGDLELSLTQFEDHVRAYPTDLVALRTLHGFLPMLGQMRRMRDGLMGAAHAWKKSMPLYPLFLGMYAFALEESDEWEFAREKAQEALCLRPDAVWAMHALAHCHEEQSPTSHGIQFLEKRHETWRPSVLGGHMAWHLALHHFSVGNLERVFELFDTELTERMKSGVIFALIDAASLLWRMECCGCEVGDERWQVVRRYYESHVGNHQLSWFNMHLMFALTHDSAPEQVSKLLLARKLLKSMEDYASSGTGHHATITKRLGLPACEALLAYATGDFEQACQKLLLVHPYTAELGFSTAQRQVCLVQLYHVAVKANDKKVANDVLSVLKEKKRFSEHIQNLPFL